MKEAWQTERALATGGAYRKLGSREWAGYRTPNSPAPPPEMILELVPILVPIFVAAGLGFGWAKLGYSYDTDFVTRLVTQIGTPCLVFSTLTAHPLSLERFGLTMASAVIAMAIFGVVGAGLLYLAGMHIRSYLPTLMLPNTGNMGLPIVLFAFGDQGLALAIAFSTMITIGHFTVGLALASGRASPKHLLTAPALYATLGAVAFIATGLPVPRWLANTTGLLGGLTIPMMLLSLGVSLARLRVASLGRSLFLGTVRLTMGFGVGVGLAWALGLDHTATGALVLQCAMPAAVLNFLWAARYHGPAEEVAGAIVVSTLMSFATLPLLLWYLL